MSDPIQIIQKAAAAALQDIYGQTVEPQGLTLQETKKEFEGDFTLVTFPLARLKVGSPPQIAEALGQALTERLEAVEHYNVIKGFLNLTLSDRFWLQWLAEAQQAEDYFRSQLGRNQTVVVEYCSPNTNKPLHLGHLRNIVLGYAITQILEATGHHVVPTCLFNDRGTNISKSMYAYLRSDTQNTPDTAGMKGDKLVGDYYVAYAQRHKQEVEQLMEEKSLDPKNAEQQATTTQAINEMTLKWEVGDPETVALWKRMNSWVYAAFNDTFERLGVHFDRFYYESEVYQRGKETVAEGLEKGVFFRDEDGAVKVDLSEDGLDQKVLLRANGTSLYITQDLAIAADKFNEFGMDKSIYVVGNEQDYHFKVLFKILEKLDKPYAQGLFHLSYGMVDLPTGKMKSREGTTVEADDLMDEMIQKAAEETEKLGKTEGLSPADRANLHRQIGLGGLKFFLAKVDPKKRMLFDPKESIDMHGQTGTFVQYSYTRTASLSRKSGEVTAFSAQISPEEALTADERALILRIFRYREVLTEAAQGYNPSLLANYAYDLARDFNRFYGGEKIIQREKPQTSAFRLALAQMAGRAMQESLQLLGIEVPEQM
jgi:arginyl-tRNA synthetase